MEEPAVPYPLHREVDVVLRDGATVRIRPARHDDRERVEDYLIGLSDESRYFRFGGASVDVSEIARRSTEIDYRDHLTLLAVADAGAGEVIGGAQYIREGDVPRAEVSVSVADALQGRGLGSILVAHLADAAGEAGISTFHAHVLPENHRMIEVFRRSGFPVHLRATPGTVDVEFPTALTEEALTAYEDRERIAAANAVRAILQPTSVAVIGASRDAQSIGGRLLHNLLDPPFAGVVHAINPKSPAVQGIAAFPSVLDVPGHVDVAFIAVPAAHVIAVARECGEKGVRGLVVISAGFAETGADGASLQRELVEVCRASGMRLIGPNCMGVVNTDPEVQLNGTFSTTWPPVGRVGFLSQSGALGIAVMGQSAELGLGLSTFVSIGNKADISGNDLLSYWDDDPNTDVVLMYLESFGNPRRFAKLARRLGKHTPIVAVKSGRSAAGSRAAMSHTGALLAASDSTVDALFRQSGVVRTDTLEQLFDVATLLANQPVPAGNRVAIVTNAGGLGILCADTCEANGLAVTELSADTVTELRSFLPVASSVSNPVDMIASASAEDYGRAIRVVAGDPGIDALIVIYIPPLEASAAEVAHQLVGAIADVGGRIPVLSCFMSARGLPEVLRAPGTKIPSYRYPEQAAIALARAVRYGMWRGRAEGHVPSFDDVQPGQAAALIAAALARGDEWLPTEEAEQLLACYGIPLPRTVSARTPEEASQAAATFGGAVVVKGIGPLHKTESGAVRLGVAAHDVLDEARSMLERVEDSGERFEGFLVQEQIDDAVEMLVGVVADPVFGPVVACGGGGVTVELQRDVAVRVAPITDVDAEEMVRSLATFPLLDGFRGAPRADVDALVQTILRVGALADAHPEIAEMDCNPVMVLPTGVRVVDVRVRIRTTPPTTPFASRSATG
jgi:acetyl coenzyme A synthetase (ADP forming)-like protein